MPIVLHVMKSQQAIGGIKSTVFMVYQPHIAVILRVTSACTGTSDLEQGRVGKLLTHAAANIVKDNGARL